MNKKKLTEKSVDSSKTTKKDQKKNDSKSQTKTKDMKTGNLKPTLVKSNVRVQRVKKRSKSEVQAAMSTIKRMPYGS